jgi:hypothetical protein
MQSARKPKDRTNASGCGPNMGKEEGVKGGTFSPTNQKALGLCAKAV